MLTNIILMSFILLFVFFILYKKDMIPKLFSNQSNKPVDHLQHQLEQTADLIIKRLEDKVIELEYLLTEADNKIKKLNEQLTKLELTPAQATEYETKNSSEVVDSEVSPNFAQHMAIASYKVNISNSKVQNSEYGSIEADSVEKCLDKQKIIIQMHKQGYSEVEIARATRLGVGEVKLFTQLYKNQIDV